MTALPSFVEFCGLRDAPLREAIWQAMATRPHLSDTHTLSAVIELMATPTTDFSDVWYPVLRHALEMKDIHDVHKTLDAAVTTRRDIAKASAMLKATANAPKSYDDSGSEVIRLIQQAREDANAKYTKLQNEMEEMKAMLQKLCTE